MSHRRGSGMVLLLVLGLLSATGRGQEPPAELPPSVLIPPETAEPPLADPGPGKPGAIQQAGFNVVENGPSQPYQPLPTGRPVDLPTPMVVLHVHAPANSAIGQELEYRLEVTNPSRASAHHVLVIAAMPAGARFVRSAPEPAAQAPELQWTVGSLGPGERREIRLTLLPGPDDSIRFAARVRFDHGQVVTTRLVKPKVVVRQSVPNEAILDDSLPFKLEVTNQSPVALTDVVVTSVLPADAEHEDGPDATGASVGGKQQRRWTLGNLPPGESRVLTYKVRATRATTIEALATVTAAGGVKEDVKQQVEVKHVALTLTMSGPPTARAGEPVSYQIQIVNNGTAPLHNVVVTDTPPPFCDVSKLSDGSRQFGRDVQWTFPTLEKGEHKILTVELKGQPGKFTHKAVVSTARGKTQQAECHTEILGSASLRLDVDSTPAGSVEVGRPVQYRLTVTNVGTAAANGVTVAADVPPQMDVTETKPQAQRSGQRLVFELGTAAPGLSQTLTVTTVAKAAGELHLKAEARDGQMTAGAGITRECMTMALPAAGALAKPAESVRPTAATGPATPTVPAVLPAMPAAPVTGGPAIAPPAPAPANPTGPPVAPFPPIPAPMGAPTPPPMPPKLP